MPKKVGLLEYSGKFLVLLEFVGKMKNKKTYNSLFAMVIRLIFEILVYEKNNLTKFNNDVILIIA